MIGDYKNISWSCIGDEDYNTIRSALKLQELVKAQILYEDELNKPFNDYERTALYLLETLVKESEK